MSYFRNVFDILSSAASISLVTGIILLIALALALLVVLRKRDRSITWGDLACFALPLTSPLALALWGAAFHRSRSDMPLVPSWQNTVTELLIWSFLPLAVVSIMLARGLRLVAAVTAVLEGWFAYWCYFGAYMRVSGDWI